MDRKKNHFILPADETGDSRDERFYQRMGIAIIFIGVLGFFVWASCAPLDKGVTAPGTVIVAGHRKTVQAPIAGIVDSVRVAEGDRVQANAPLITLSRTTAQARYEQARDKYLAALASTARLKAERDNQAAPDYPESLRQPAWLAQGEMNIALQDRLFEARRKALLGDINTHQQMLNGLVQQANNIQRALDLKRKSHASLQQQLRDMKSLTDERVLPLNRYRELERQQHDAQSQTAELSGQLAITLEKQEEMRKRIELIQSEYHKEVNTQLAKAVADIDEQQKQMEIARYELEHTQILAPLSGTVMALNIFTAGSVLSVGETLMEIVPDGAPLMVEAQIGADLIDKVYPGLAVDMMFTALNQNKTPVIPGSVSLVSPDRLTNRHSGEPYYQIQIAVSEEGMALLHQQDIRPGMPVAVLIKTGARSLLSYLFKPLIDRSRTALTEE